MVNQTKFPVPLIKAQLDASGITHVIDLSSTSIITLPSNLVPVSAAHYAEQNVYTIVSGAVDPSDVYIETDIIAWDADHNIVYQHVEIDGRPGPFLNEINVFVTLINDATYDLPEDDTLVSDISGLVARINCTRAEGMGTLAEYAALLDLAKDASSNISLTLDISGLEQFAAVAESYGAIFEDITQNLSLMTTIDSVSALTLVKAELQKIADMYDNLDSLKLEIRRTATLRIPDSIQQTADQLQTVYSELECTLDYLEYFCGMTGTAFAPEVVQNSAMNARDKAAIDAATGALLAYKAIAENQGSVTAYGNTQVVNLTNKINQFHSLKERMQNAATCLTNGLTFGGRTDLTFNPTNNQ
jgi:hypothetical protein